MGIKLAFMGTATFALPALNALFENGYTITGVITQPDKPSGRGQTLHAPPIKVRAHEVHLPIYQPKSLKTDEARELVTALAPDLIVVVAYGKILPPWLLQLPKYGCINVHGSLLPKYRGAAPVHWAIANGEEKTGVCTMLLDEGLDTGGVFLCDETNVDPNESLSELYDRLAAMGGPLIVKTVQGVVEGVLKPKPQDESQATPAPILKKEHGFIDWSRPAREIHNRVRAFNPWPGTVTKFRGQTCKILKTGLGDEGSDPSSPGLLVAMKNELRVMCGDGRLLQITTIQPENRKAISGRDFANGSRLQPNEKFEQVMDNGTA